jgi:hypothetical protein
VAFTGFTPEFQPRKGFAAPIIVSGYFLDQEFVNDPSTRAYFDLYMRLVAAVVEEKPVTDYRELLAARDKPLFETLQDQPAAALQLPKSVQATLSGSSAKVTFDLQNGLRYARLVRLRAVWESLETENPYLEVFEDNYFDLMPGESRQVSLELRLPRGVTRAVKGKLIVAGSNLAPQEIPVTISPPPASAKRLATPEVLRQGK